MKRLTTDTPNGNFETMLNYVYGKDGFAHIRYAGEKDDVPLTEWAKAQCCGSRCPCPPDGTPDEIDETICNCLLAFPDCSIALAYCFACQAVHLRDRLKRYEDVLFDAEGRELVTLERLKGLAAPPSAEPLTLDELRKMSWEPAWVDGKRERLIGHSGWGILYYSPVENQIYIGWPLEKYGDIPSLDSYGNTWLAYRCKPDSGGETWLKS